MPVPLIPRLDRDRIGASLPVPLTSFVGRAGEIAQIGALLRGDARLVTVTGPGGVGKTRLALRVATDLAPGFSDGVAFVGLASVTDHSLVLPTVAQALGVREVGDRPLDERLVDALKFRSALLVLDNFEHVVAAAPSVVHLLAGCPDLAILVTSRAPLRISGEQVVPIAPLAVPDPTDSHASLTDSDAVRLFVARARAADPTFALDAENGRTIAAICRRLDGLPLAVELAAAKARVLPPAALLPRLERALPLLTGGVRDAPARQRTVQDAIAWSHDLLTPEERAAFRRLAVFVGGFTLEAAEAVVAGPELPAAEVLAGIEALEAQSLVRRLNTATGESRFGMLETIREFGLERLRASGDLEATNRAHRGWCLALAEDSVPVLEGPAGSNLEAVTAVLHRLAAEHDNLRAALGWVTERGEAELAMRLVSALREFWWVRGHLREGRQWSESALAMPGAPSVIRGWALLTLGVMLWANGDLAGARPFFEKGQTIARVDRDPVLERKAVILLGMVASQEGDLDEATSWYEQALMLARALGDRIKEQTALVDLGQLAHDRGDLAGATARYEVALPIARALGYPRLLCTLTLRLAAVLGDLGQTRRAAALERESLALARALVEFWALADQLADTAALAVATGRAEAAALLVGAADALRAGSELPVGRVNVPRYARAAAAIRGALGEAAFEAARAAGADLPLAMALDEADALLAELAEAPEPVAPVELEAPGGLSPRELEVVRLLAAGHSNREIAAALFIGPATVHTHLANVYSKLDVGSRTAAVAAARRLGVL